MAACQTLGYANQTAVHHRVIIIMFMIIMMIIISMIISSHAYQRELGYDNWYDNSMADGSIPKRNPKTKHCLSRGHTGVCEKNTPPEKRTLGTRSLKNTKSGPGEGFLPLGCMAKAREKGLCVSQTSLWIPLKTAAYYTILYDTILYCTILYYTTRSYPILSYPILSYTILACGTSPGEPASIPRAHIYIYIYIVYIYIYIYSSINVHILIDAHTHTHT